MVNSSMDGRVPDDDLPGQTGDYRCMVSLPARAGSSMAFGLDQEFTQV